MSASPPSSRKPPGIQVPAGNSANGGCLKGCLWVVLGILAIAIIVGISSCGKSRTPSSSDNKYESIAQCEARVEKLLKAPSTADFDSSATGFGAGPWTVTGTVDAQNSFGATVRADYGCTVTVNGDTATTKVDYFNE